MRTHPRITPQVDAYLRSCFINQTPPKVYELALLLGLSRFTLGLKFRRERGMTLGAYFKQQQIKRGEKLLRTTRLSIPTIARRAAFNNERTFRRAFRRETGTTPSAYRRSATSLKSSLKLSVVDAGKVS